MTFVSIGGTLLPLAYVTDEWVRVALTECARWRRPFCVRVDITHGDVQLTLATPTCLILPKERVYNGRERGIIDAWERRGLHSGHVNADDLLAFLKELEGML